MDVLLVAYNEIYISILQISQLMYNLNIHVSIRATKFCKM